MSESNIRGVLRAFLGPIQDLEDAAQAVLRALNLDTATGWLLDRFGKIVLQPREGTTDAVYRRRIRAKIAANRSDGTGERLIAVGRAFVGSDPTAVHVVPSTIMSAYVRLENSAVDDASAAALFELLKLAKGAGVRLILWYSTYAPAQTFSFAQAAHLSGGHSIGQTTLTVDSTAGFPATGTLTVDSGTAVAETFAYTSITPTTFAGPVGLAHNHDDRTSATLQVATQAFGSGHYAVTIT